MKQERTDVLWEHCENLDKERLGKWESLAVKHVGPPQIWVESFVANEISNDSFPECLAFWIDSLR